MSEPYTYNNKNEKQIKNIEILEKDEPILIGSRTFKINLSNYIKQTMNLCPPKTNKTTILKSKIQSQVSHRLIVDLLKDTTWKIIPHKLGRGTSPLFLQDPVNFIENIQNCKLSNRIRDFLSKRYEGIPGLGPRCDLIVANKKHFVLLEIKSTTRESNLFQFNSFKQFLFFIWAVELNVPVKLILCKFAGDILRILISNSPGGELIKKGQIVPKAQFNLRRDGMILSLIILKHCMNPSEHTFKILNEADPFKVCYYLDIFVKEGLIKGPVPIETPLSLKREDKRKFLNRKRNAFFNEYICTSTPTITYNGVKKFDEIVQLLEKYNNFISYSKLFLELISEGRKKRPPKSKI